MKKPILMVKLIATLSLVLVSFNLTFASETDHSPHHEGEEHHDTHLVDKVKFGNDFIIEHVLDAHDWHLFDIPTSEGGGDKFKPVSIPLPIILLDGGLKFSMSSKFEHGHSIAEIGGEHYFIFKEKVYKTDKAGSVTLNIPNPMYNAKDENSKEEKYLEQKTTFHELSSMHNVAGLKVMNAKPWDFSITKGVLTLFITALIMLWMFSRVGKFYKKNGANKTTSGITSFIEPIVVFVRDDIAIPNIGEKKHNKFMPYLLTVFFFIWIANLLGLLPLGLNLTGNIAVTLCLALFTMLITAFNGNKNYWGHIFWMPGVPVPMKIFLAPIEVIGMFAKPFALMIRLFANITAGHIVIMSLIGLMFAMESLAWSPLSVLMTLFINVLELLVAALQAYVFTMLSALFIGAAVEEAHH